MISLCTIVKNEEAHIANCINSVKALVDEIIIVDTGSTDKTKEIAKGLGATLYEFPWNNNFSDAKNFAISKATQPWILQLDADETLSSQDHEKIKSLIQEPYLGFYLIQRNYSNQSNKFSWTSSTGDKYEESKIASGFTPRKMLRLFKNTPEIKFTGIVHESVIQSIPKEKIKDTEIPIHHYGLLQEDKEKLARYIEAGKQQEKTFFTEYQLGAQLHQLGKLQEAMTHLSESIRLNPNFHLSLIEFSIILIKTGKISEAKPLLLQSIKIQPHEMAYSHLGIVNAYEKNLPEAINCFQKAIDLNPKNPSLYHNLGQALTQSGQTEKAQEAFKKEKELKGD